MENDQETEEKKKQKQNLVDKQALNSFTTNAYGSFQYARIIFDGSVPCVIALRKFIEKTAQEVSSGNLQSMEEMLAAQAISLNAIFTDLAYTASRNIHNPELFEKLLRLSLKAQSNCRATAETLAEMKNPRASVAFVKQANISHGHQQVNNGVLMDDASSEGLRSTQNEPQTPPACGEKNKKSTNKLLNMEEENNEKRLDTKQKSQTSGDDSPMATMETINRGKNP